MLDNITVVLVKTSHPGNVGAAARAMKTMGLTSLVLVDPASFPDSHATARAAGAADVLANARVVSSLEEAVSGSELVIGTSSRQRRIPWPIMDARKCGEVCIAQAVKSPVSLVFGQEDRGLSNEELQMCHYHVSIPANEEYGVLNVAASVQVLCYELHMAWLELQEKQESGSEDVMMPVNYVRWDEELASQEDLERFITHFEETLLDMDFFDPENPRQLMTRVRRLFTRARMDKLEMNLLRGVLTAMQKRLK